MNIEYDKNGNAINLVLIDTWWNVNGIIVRINSGGGDGFNRYMVECEYYYLMLFKIFANRFNRYMVECECWIPEAGERVIASFNRYMVECE